MEVSSEEKKKAGKAGLVILITAVVHAVFYFAPNLYLPFDLEERFLLGYALVLVDSSLLAFVGIKFLFRLRRK